MAIDDSKMLHAISKAGQGIIRACIASSVTLSLAGCATTFVAPAGPVDSSLRERATIIEDDGIIVAGALASAAEARSIYGIDLTEKGIQPVWLEIRNTTDRQLLYLPTGTDAEYFSPLEVAFGYRKQFTKDSRARLGERLEELTLSTRIPPMSTVSGFVLTNQSVGAKVVSIDLIGDRYAKNFNFVVINPDSVVANINYERARSLIAQIDTENITDEKALRASIDALPCCVTDSQGNAVAPVNIVIIGQPEAITTALKRRNYHFKKAAFRYLFGRDQDLSGVKQAAWVDAQPHIIRLWVAPFRYRGAPVWTGHVVMPLGGRFAGLLAGDNDELIDPNVDLARLDFAQDLLYSQKAAKIGFSSAVDQADTRTDRPTPAASDYRTDGLRAVILLDEGNRTLENVRFFDWQRLAEYGRVTDSGADSRE